MAKWFLLSMLAIPLLGLRLAVGDDRPLPYASSMAVKAGLVADKRTASNALNALVRGGVELRVAVAGDREIDHAPAVLDRVRRRVRPPAGGVDAAQLSGPGACGVVDGEKGVQ